MKARCSIIPRRSSKSGRPLFIILAAAVLAAAFLAAVAAPAGAISQISGWHQVYDNKNPGVGYADLDFVDSSRGWVVGDAGSIVKTSDGGVTWKAQSSGISADLLGVAFSDAAHGWAVAEYGILATGDGGVTWTVKKTTTDQYELSDIACAGDGHAWAVGSDIRHLSPIILATVDDGTTWTSAGVDDMLGVGYRVLSRVAFVDATHGWAVGSQGLIVVTVDGGTTWTTQRQPVSAASALNGVTFTDATHGWAVGENGTVLTTSDGGVTWVRQDSWTDLPLYSVWFSDREHGWAVGWDGVLATTNGGQNWLSQPLSFMSVLRTVDFVGLKNGWAADGFGRIYATTSGGVPDTRGPQTYAENASGRRGSRIALRFKVVDDYSRVATDVRIVVRLGAKVVRTIRVGGTPETGVWHSLKWTPEARGTYRYQVHAKDQAGNPQSTMGSARILVR